MNTKQQFVISAEGIAEAVVEALATRGVIVPRLMNLDQAAAYLGMTRSAVQTKALRGQLPTVKLDSTLRFDKHELDKLIEQVSEPAVKR